LPYSVIERTLPVGIDEAKRRFSERIASPGVLPVSRKYVEQPYLEGVASEDGFLVWLKRWRRGIRPLMVAVRFRSIADGTILSAELPAKRKPPSGALAAVLLGWLLLCPAFILNVYGEYELPWAPWLAVPLAGLLAILLYRAMRYAESEELRPLIEQAVESLSDAAV
jgi:hypothetical protein